jgi:hypothetical protein
LLGKIPGCVKQGNHEPDRAANIDSIEHRRIHDAAVDAGDGDSLDPETIVELVGETGCQVLFFGGFHISLNLDIDGKDEWAAEGIFARNRAGEKRK